MFYDRPGSWAPWQLARAAITWLTLVLLLPIITFAMLPVMMLLLPVAFVVGALMLASLVGGADKQQVETPGSRVWHSQPALRDATA